MHKDFAKKRKLPSKLKRRSTKLAAYANTNTAWIGMASGLILGLILSALLYWKIHPQHKSPIETPIAINENASSQKKASRKNTAQRFDFYTVLSENDAKADPYSALPELKSPVQSHTQAQQQPLHPAEPKPVEIKAFKPSDAKPFSPSDIPYILQVGSFKHFEQADKLRLQLSLSGHKASIQTFKMNTQDTWYRVYIGPFKNRDEALQQQAKLEQKQPIDSLIVKFCV